VEGVRLAPRADPADAEPAVMRAALEGDQPEPSDRAASATPTAGGEQAGSEEPALPTTSSSSSVWRRPQKGVLAPEMSTSARPEVRETDGGEDEGDPHASGPRGGGAAGERGMATAVTTLGTPTTTTTARMTTDPLHINAEDHRCVCVCWLDRGHVLRSALVGRELYTAIRM
jgi:hypothetical protein